MKQRPPADGADHEADGEHQQRTEQPGHGLAPARGFLVVEGGDPLHHLAEVAGAFADPQQAHGDRRRQSVGLHGLRHRPSGPDPFRGLDELVAEGGGEQAAHHPQGREDGNAAAQQHAERPVTT